MSSFVYDKGRESFLKAEINWATDNIKVAAVSSAYTPNAASDQFLTDISGVLATSGNLASKTTTAGVADAADITYTAFTGAAVALVVYQDTGTGSTSRLIAYIDSPDFNVTGVDVTIQWDNGANKIYKL